MNKNSRENVERDGDKQASRNMARKAASVWCECSAYNCASVGQLLISPGLNCYNDLLISLGLNCHNDLLISPGVTVILILKVCFYNKADNRFKLYIFICRY